ncbi:hypothetical protein FBU30_005210 [Linnemannia zychae]|nr:hypothetical protein FBU30_005210 [Linnemannia zychae]
MRFTVLSLIFALQTAFLVTTATTAITIPTNNHNDLFLPRRHLYPRYDSKSQTPSDTIYSSNSSPQFVHPFLPSSFNEKAIIKRQKPRRLAGDKRGDGLLGGLVNELVSPKTSEEAPSENGPESKPEPSPTITVDPEPAHDSQDKSDYNTSDEGQQEEPTSPPSTETPTNEEQATSTETPVTSTDVLTATTDSVAEPTDTVDTVASSPSTTTTSGNQSSGQMDPTASKASKNEEVGPTSLPEHKQETNNDPTALVAGVIVTIVVIASLIGVWIFRKWKLSLLRRFKSKVSSGIGKATVGSTKSDHEYRPDYNSDEKYNAETYKDISQSSMASSPAYPATVAGHEGTEFDYGYAHYEKLQQQQQQAMNDNYQSYHYEHNAETVVPLNEVSVVQLSVKPNPVGSNLVGGISATGHNIHGYGSEDYSKNDHFLRELRE